MQIKAIDALSLKKRLAAGDIPSLLISANRTNTRVSISKARGSRRCRSCTRRISAMCTTKPRSSTATVAGGRDRTRGS